MAKKRKTRKEKIILQLKRELARERQKRASANIKFEPRQEGISKPAKKESIQPPKEKKSDISIQFFDPRLIKKDLLKTIILTIIVISLELVLYWKLR